jgi:hypothetical protein
MLWDVLASIKWLSVSASSALNVKYLGKVLLSAIAYKALQVLPKSKPLAVSVLPTY